MAVVDLLLLFFGASLGVQILLRDYDFTTSPAITDDDIIAVFPVVKHTDFKVSPSPSPSSPPHGSIVVFVNSPRNQLHCMKWHCPRMVLVKSSQLIKVVSLMRTFFMLGQLHVAHELFASCLQMFVQVYGPMHLDTANCYRYVVCTVLILCSCLLFPYPHPSLYCHLS